MPSVVARFYWISITQNRLVAIKGWGTIPATGRYATLKSITHPTLCPRSFTLSTDSGACAARAVEQFV